MNIYSSKDKVLMKNSNLKICNEVIHAGEQASLALPLPEMFSCAPMYMPLKVFHGKQKGPCMVVIATMHGNELNGTEIINRLLTSHKLKKLKGTLILVPILNVHAFINKSRTLPSGTHLDRAFPGSENGSLASRLAHLFAHEIFSLADYCVDLRTGSLNYSNLPQVFVTKGHSQDMDLAESFGAPVIAEVQAIKGSLRAYAQEKGIPYLIYEAGEAMRFDEHAIQVGVKGILNLLKKVDMLSKAAFKAMPKKSLPSFCVKGSRWLHAPTSGLVHSQIQLGQYVKKGDILCEIQDPFGSGDPMKVTASVESVVVAKNNLPLVHEGQSLFQLAVFDEDEEAVAQLEDWEEQASEHLKTGEE